MFAIRQIAVIFAALFLLPSVLGAALAPRASGTPKCEYTCPPYDKKGNELDKQMDTGPNIKCTYGHNPVRNCFYDREDGSPKNGNSSKCPDKADKKEHSSPQKRANRALLDAFEVQRKRRAAMPAPSVPDYMNTRSALKKRSHETDCARRRHFVSIRLVPPTKMAAKSKARTLIVRLVSTAQTGFFYTTQRLRQGPKLSAVKYDPVVKQRVLFVESKKTKKG